MPEFIDYNGEAYVYGQLPEKDAVNKDAYLDTLYVPPEMRGQGLGKHFLLVFLGRCLSAGAGRVWAEFKPFEDTDLDELRSFYEYMGFHFYTNEDGVLCLEKNLHSE